MYDDNDSNTALAKGRMMIMMRTMITMIGTIGAVTIVVNIGEGVACYIGVRYRFFVYLYLVAIRWLSLL